MQSFCLTFFWVKLCRIAISGANPGDETTAVISLKQHQTLIFGFNVVAMHEIKLIISAFEPLGERVIPREGNRIPAHVWHLQRWIDVKAPNLPFENPQSLSIALFGMLEQFLQPEANPKKWLIRSDPLANRSIKPCLLKSAHRIDNRTLPREYQSIGIPDLIQTGNELRIGTDMLPSTHHTTQIAHTVINDGKAWLRGFSVCAHKKRYKMANLSQDASIQQF